MEIRNWPRVGFRSFMAIITIQIGKWLKLGDRIMKLVIWATWSLLRISPQREYISGRKPKSRVQYWHRSRSFQRNILRTKMMVQPPKSTRLASSKKSIFLRLNQNMLLTEWHPKQTDYMRRTWQEGKSPSWLSQQSNQSTKQLSIWKTPRAKTPSCRLRYSTIWQKSTQKIKDSETRPETKP